MARRTRSTTNERRIKNSNRMRSIWRINKIKEKGMIRTMMRLNKIRMNRTTTCNRWRTYLQETRQKKSLFHQSLRMIKMLKTRSEVPRIGPWTWREIARAPGKIGSKRSRRVATPRTKRSMKRKKKLRHNQFRSLLPVEVARSQPMLARWVPLH